MVSDDHRRHLYERCVHAHGASLYRVAYRLTGNHDASNELVQETFLHAWKDLSKLQDESKIHSWMFSILRNQYSKGVRKVSPLQSLSDSQVEVLARQPAADHREIETMLQEAVNQLDD